MPNHVTNEINVKCNPLVALRISLAIGNISRNNIEVDFNRLIPSPPHVYRGNLSGQDERDFPLNWHTWNSENWGTKWNAYNSHLSYKGGNLVILFDTAWRTPRPFICAFANKFKMPFVLHSFDEGWNFALTEVWGKDAQRMTVRNLDHKNEMEYELLCDMCLRLKGYDPRERDEEE